MRIILIAFFLLQSIISIGQQDTINAVIKHRKIGRNYELYEQKIGVDVNGTLIFDDMEVHDFFIPFLDKSRTGTIVLRLHDKRKKIFAIGKWNEAGFQETVTYYNRKGKIILTKYFEGETFTPIE